MKVRPFRCAFRRVQKGESVASLLLGPHDDAGLLNHDGFSSGIAAGQRPDVLRRLEPLIKAPIEANMRPIMLR